MPWWRWSTALLSCVVCFSCSAGHSELSVRHLLTSRVPGAEPPSTTVLDMLRQDQKYRKEYIHVDFNALPEGAVFVLFIASVPHDCVCVVPLASCCSMVRRWCTSVSVRARLCASLPRRCAGVL